MVAHVLSRLPEWSFPTLAGLGALAACAGVAMADPSAERGPVLCPFRALTGRPCPGCGSLRAVDRLAAGDLAGAFGANALFVLLLPVAAYVWVEWLSSGTGRAGPPRPRLSTRGWWVALAGFVAFGVLRNLPALGFLAP